MPKTKRILSLLMSALMLSSAAACSNNNTESEIGSSASSDSNPAAESETAVEYLDDLPDDLDFGGADIRFASAKDTASLWVGEEDDLSAPINEAVWKRNNLITERINVEIVEPFCNYEDFETLMAASVLSNSDDYDAYQIYARFGIKLAADGIMKNLDNIDYLDFSKDYWNDKYMSNLSYKNIHFWAGGEITYTYISGAGVLFANTDLWNQYWSGDSLYEIVMNSDWTLDEMIARGDGVYIDANGDGQRGVKDTYGLSPKKVLYQQTDSFLVQKLSTQKPQFA